MAAVLLFAVLAGAGAVVVRRWGTGHAPDPLAELVRRPFDALRGVPWDKMPLRAVAGVQRAVSWVRTLRPVRPLTPALAPAWETSATLFAAEGTEDRRGFFRRRRERVQEPPPDVLAPESEPTPPPPPSPPERPVDHVPLAPVREREEDGAAEERLRDRFRRGLRKTRDYLNRDVREVFGSGPVPEAFDSLEEILVRADVGVATATALADELRERGRELTSDTLPGALRDALRHSLRDTDRRLRVNPDRLSVWLVVGVNGTGKTTSVAKLAAHASRLGFKVCIAAADTFRAAAIEQLETWGDRLGIEVVRQHAGADPAAVVFDAIEHAKARGYDLVIADTAGRLHTRTPLMEELRKVRRVIERDDPSVLTETLLVLDATTGQNGIAQARAFAESVDVTGLVLAKLDGTAKGGIVIAVERDLQIAVKAVGVGEKPDDLAPFDPDAFVEAFFG